MNKRKLLLVALSLCMVAILAMGGTLAYLTDTDDRTNTFTVGNVDIILEESFGNPVTDEDGNPVVDEEGGQVYDTKLMPGKDITKTAWIENTADEAAWVWAELWIPAVLDNGPEEFNASKNVLHFNNYGYFTTDYNPGYMASAVADGWINAEGNVVDEAMVSPVSDYLWSDFEYDRTETVGELDYYVYVTKMQNTLESGMKTLPFLRKVFLDTRVDYDHVTEKWYWVEDYERTEITDLLSADTIDLLVYGYAIQAEGFDTVDEAYAAYYVQYEK